MPRSVLLSVLALALLLPLAPVSAHLAGGSDIETGEYLVDFGHDPADPVAGAPTVFAINLVDMETHADVIADEAFVRLSKGDHIAFSGTMVSVQGNVTFSAVLPEPGTYEYSVRFKRDGQEIVSAATVVEAVAALVAAAPVPAVEVRTAPEPQAARRRTATEVVYVLTAFVVGMAFGKRRAKA